MNKELFSVLIANYNGSKYITECLNSIKNQTYKNVEIVIVDDCSEDNSEEIIKEFSKTSGLKVVYEKNIENKGCGYSKSRAAELATGEICGFLDSDDSLELDAIEKMVKYHEDNPSCGLVSSRYFVCNSKLKKLYKAEAVTNTNFTNYLLSPRLTHFNTFKRYLYLKTDGIDKKITHGVDQDLCLKMEEVADIMFIPEALYNYRTYEKSISHGKGAQIATFFNVYIRIEACKRRCIPVSIVNNVYKLEIPKHNIFVSRIIKLVRILKFRFFKETKSKSLIMKLDY